MRDKYVKIVTSLFFTLAAATSLSAQNTNTALSLDQCIEITLQNNPKISAAYSSTEAQRNKLSQTRADFLPQVNASAGYTRSDSEDATGWKGAGDNYSSSISASQLIYDFGKTGLSSSMQKNTYFASLEDTQNTVNNTIYELKQAYYAVLSAKEQRDVYKKSVEQYQEQLKRARAFFNVGTRPKIDVTTAQVNLNNAKLNLIQAENSLKIAQHKLLNIMGIHMESFTLQEQRSIPDYKITLDEALDAALENRPDLLSYKLKLESARQNVKLSATGFAPSLNATGSYGWSGGDFPLYDRWSVGANVSLPIFSGFSTYNKVKESKNNLSTAYYNLTDAQQSALLDVRTAYFNLEEAKSRIPVAKVSQQESEENYKLAVGRYTVGVGNYIEVKDAEVTLSNAKLNYISAVFDYNLAIADLKRAMGTR